MSGAPLGWLLVPHTPSPSQKYSRFPCSTHQPHALFSSYHSTQALLPPYPAYSHLLFLPESFHPASAAPNVEEASQILLNPLPLCNSSAFASWNSHSVEFIFMRVFPAKLESAGRQSAMTFCPDYIPYRCFIFKTEKKGKLLGEEEA